MLIRRTLTDKDLTFYVVYAPNPTPLRTFVHVAGLRWRIEEGFASAKELTGLDEHQVRTWTSWHRWTLFAMLAHAFISITAMNTAAGHDDPELALITRNERRHLLAVTLFAAMTSAFRMPGPYGAVTKPRHAPVPPAPSGTLHHRSRSVAVVSEPW